MNRILLLILFGILLSLRTNAATWYVNSNATGANNGTSWMNAFSDLQDAIAASAFGDQIWVASGIYKPTSTTTRTIYFQIKNGTKVYGGFNGTETLLSERDPEVHVTVLSGDIATASAVDNSYHVVYLLNTGNQTLINGFKITGGMAILNGSADVGGGVYASGSSAVVENCKFISNSGDYGGAFGQVNTGICTVRNCVFEANFSYNIGGAVYLSNDQAFFTDCYFASNQSSGDGGAVYLNSSEFSFDRCVFAGNTSADDGSAFYVGNFATLILSNSLLVGNYTSGQEVISMNETFNQQINKLINCTIAHNRQLQNGAGTRAITMNSLSSIANTIIWDNGGEAEVLATGTSIDNCIIQPASNNPTGTNVLSTDPLFTMPGSLTTAPFDTVGLDYHLMLFSPGIDFGSNLLASGTADLDENPRIQGVIDLGAYETGFCNSPLTFDQAAPYVICGGTPITLSVPGAVDYIWSNGATTSSVTANAAGTYSVIFEDTSGCRGNLQAVVTTSSNPAPNIAFSGGSLNAGTFATYQWSFNGSPISGATSSTHVPMEGYGVYTVDVTNSSGCSGTDTYCFSPAALSATGPTSFCPGGSVTLNITGGTGFVWSNGELDSSITVTSAGTYTVTVQNASAGCSVSFQQVVTVLATPAPVVTHNSGFLTTGSFSTYQWSFNGSSIPGANSQNLAPTNGNGQYTVTVSNASGCTGTSVIYNYNNLGLEENTPGLISIFPNPVSGNGTLQLTSEELITGTVTILIYDARGAVSLEVNASELPESIALPDLKPGIYFMDIQTENKRLKGLKISVI